MLQHLKYEEINFIFRLVNSMLYYYDYTNQSIWREFKRELSVDIGLYPNDVFSFKNYIQDLKDIFALSEVYTNEAVRR